ncbi:MAG: 1-deoxy-D-xylulose-5-phosphate synthase [Candidatus Omnitrophica bacterium]|nr:1-deoxy-D-xylulose-5-phosphate synthase [Candidatus Omnitrophota bacterium]
MGNSYPLLSRIQFPGDVSEIPLEQLPALAEEVRRRIIEATARCGGHLASSLGAVELTIALHYCLDIPKDKIIFDVGHQCYAHKILTGRNQHFATLRQYGGISGFPCCDESPCDSFTTGHSSTAVSLALGLACARDLMEEKDYFRVVAIIGDGSLSGGLCFEGLNNAGHLKKDVLVILNTNEMSIAPNVGALSTYLNKLISMPIYNHFKNSLDNFVKSRLPKGSRIIKLANKFEEGLKGLFVPGLLFEELGFRYFGPFDGHNLSTLVPTLNNIVHIKGPRVVHILTKKGKGYSPAEKEPVKFHSTGPFDITTGKGVSAQPQVARTYTEIFSAKLTELAAKNEKIIAITAAMPEGTGLDRFRDLFPKRFFDVGIAEEHAVCFSSGLAKQGFKPVVAIYSTFLQRAYDQIIEEVALQKAEVLFALDRAGIVGEDGFTHQGIFDIAFLRSVPGLVLMAPSCEKEFELMIEFALSSPQAVALRYPKAIAPVSLHLASPIQLGKAELIRDAEDVFIVALGSMVMPSLEAIALLEKEGIHAGLVNARFAKPLDVQLLRSIAARAAHIITVEEGVLEGGFGSAVAEALNRPVARIGLPCEFITHGSRALLLEKYGLSKEGIAGTVVNLLKGTKIHR